MAIEIIRPCPAFQSEKTGSTSVGSAIGVTSPNDVVIFCARLTEPQSLAVPLLIRQPTSQTPPWPLLLLDRSDVLLRLGQNDVAGYRHDLGCRGAGLGQLGARCFSQPVKPIVAHFAVITHDRLQSRLAAPVSEAIAKCRRACEWATMCGQQKRQFIGGRQGIDCRRQ